MNLLTCSLIKKICFLTGLLLILISCKPTTTEYVEKINLEPSIDLQKVYVNDLQKCANYMEHISNTSNTDSLEFYFKKARTEFKKIEPILSFHDLNNYNFLNAPNILKVEEEDLTDVKINKASSFQTLEEDIFNDYPDVTAIHKTAHKIHARLKFIHRNTNIEYLKPYHILWMVLKQLVRTATTGVTGFDSPVLENSLMDAVTAFAKAEQILDLYEYKFSNNDLKTAWKSKFNKAEDFLTSTNFNEFNRYEFIKKHIDPLLVLWVETAQDWNVHFPLQLAINNDATSLFSKEALTLDFFAGKNVSPINEEQIKLGKRLFNDKNLSSSQSISCASCHKLDLAFTDGLKKSKGLNRNSPSLTYSAYQQGFFYDKRAGSLEGQIVSVINNSKEFHSDLKSFASSIDQDSSYIKEFDKVYETTIDQNSIRLAIANYVRSLNYWNSKWDRNIRNELNTLTASEINGFNLFNGKAKCATCHFAPVFNGTVPPDFVDTEMEHLGVPVSAVTTNATIDPDLGRFELFKTESRKHFFKTPSIRNIALTSPYMHNGVYKTLEEVVEFYNLGGGYGIGIIDQEFQTLPADPLNLTDQEKTDLVNFMKTLTDEEFLDVSNKMYN
ncbi:methylamine utilization protein [Nonlabens dokdonensis]|uniref:Methylamine utilization protein n=1 Tax=Nonlabens dokdonensis TaxID=328515 RepID=A0A1Z8B8A7_9FLAO|nr:methylamine utilization protein [Nonlabens dokdonensis]